MTIRRDRRTTPGCYDNDYQTPVRDDLSLRFCQHSCGYWELCNSPVRLYYKSRKALFVLQHRAPDTRYKVRIRSPHEISPAIEQELLNAFPLQKAMVINTQFSPYIDSLRQIGKAGVDHLDRLLQEHLVLGVAWGKTIYSVITLVPQITSLYNGTYHFFDAPLYVKDTVRMLLHHAQTDPSPDSRPVMP